MINNADGIVDVGEGQHKGCCRQFSFQVTPLMVFIDLKPEWGHYQNWAKGWEGGGGVPAQHFTHVQLIVICFVTRGDVKAKNRIHN